MEQGQIQVSAITSRAKIPVADATVVITGQKNTPQEPDTIYGVAVTNQSGVTPILAIQTPPTSASTSPVKRRGYALLDIWVEHPGYITQKIQGVQVFPGIQTQQSVLLIPLAEGQSSLVEQTKVTLPTQEL